MGDSDCELPVRLEAPGRMYTTPGDLLQSRCRKYHTPVRQQNTRACPGVCPCLRTSGEHPSVPRCVCRCPRTPEHPSMLRCPCPWRRGRHPAFTRQCDWRIGRPRVAFVGEAVAPGEVNQSYQSVRSTPRSGGTPVPGVGGRAVA